MLTNYDKAADTLYLSFSSEFKKADLTEPYTSDILFRYINSKAIGVTILNYSFHDAELLEELIFNELKIKVFLSDAELQRIS